MASEHEFKNVKKLLEKKGYVLSRISGLHHIFTKKGTMPISIPVHNKKVKDYYVRQISKIE